MGTLKEDKESKGLGKRARLLGRLVIILLAAIIVLSGFTVFRLVRWNRGVAIEAAAGDDSGIFDVEIEDQVFLREEDLDAVAEGMRILCLGNSPFSDDTTETGLAGRIAYHTGAEVYNAAFPGSRVAAKNPQYDESYRMDVLSFFYISEFLRQRDLSAMTNVAEEYSNPQYMAAIQALETFADEDPDMIVIMYDGTDYVDGSPCYDEDNEMNPMSFAGAYRYGLHALKERFPSSRIVVMSMTWCLTYDEEGNMVDGDMTDMGNGKLPAYWTKLIDVCNAEGVTFIDNYYGTVSVENVREYLTDNIHLTSAAFDHIAKHFAEALFDETKEETP